MGFGVSCCRELVALGSAVRDFLRPDMVVIRRSDGRAGDLDESIHPKLCENKAPLFSMALMDAEIMKVALDSYVTLKMGFANALGNLCERIPAANLDVITRALAADRRIGPYYVQPGLAFGGTCFRRDSRAYPVLAKRCGLDAVLMEAVEAVNGAQHRHLADLILQEIQTSPQKTVPVLGLAFKANTNVIEESPAIKLIQELLRHGVRVAVYDRLAMENTRAVFVGKIDYAKSVRDCVAESDLCVTTTLDKEYRDIDESYIAHDRTTILDCWRLLDPSRFGGGTRYVPPGLGYRTGAAPIEEGEDEAALASWGFGLKRAHTTMLVSRRRLF